MTYLVGRSPENIALARKRVVVPEWEDGSVELHCEGRRLPYSVFDKNPVVSQGAVVENKRLGAVLSVIQMAHWSGPRTAGVQEADEPRKAPHRRAARRGGP